MAGYRYRGPDVVRKRLVDEQKRTSMPRALAAGTGMAAIAWGGSRGKILGRGLRMGASDPSMEAGLRRVFTAAEAARRATERTTEPLGALTGRGIGRLPLTVRQSLEAVPQPLRPAAATLVGTIMVNHARPVRQKTYTPVVFR